MLQHLTDIKLSQIYYRNAAEKAWLNRYEMIFKGAHLNERGASFYAGNPAGN
jgi:hypothetical protein